MASPPQITVVEEFKGVQGSTYPRVSALSQAPDHHRGEGATEPAGDVLHFLTEDLRPGAPHTLSSVVQSGWLTRWVPGVDNGQTLSGGHIGHRAGLPGAEEPGLVPVQFLWTPSVPAPTGRSRGTVPIWSLGWTTVQSRAVENSYLLS